MNSVSVCLSAHLHISETACPNFTDFSLLVKCGRCSLRLWRQCGTLCTSVFVDNVIFSNNGARRVHQCA